MALRKVFRAKCGMDVEYWRIVFYSINPATKEVHVIIAPYVNEDARRAGALYIEDDAIRVDIFKGTPKVVGEETVYTCVYDERFAPDVLDATGKNLVEALYIFVKEENEFFADAVDC